jgi:hypothetical protein
MAETEDIQPLVCDNGTGMVKVLNKVHFCWEELWFDVLIVWIVVFVPFIFFVLHINAYGLLLMVLFRPGLLEMMLQEPFSLAL